MRDPQVFFAQPLKCVRVKTNYTPNTAEFTWHLILYWKTKKKVLRVSATSVRRAQQWTHEKLNIIDRHKLSCIAHMWMKKVRFFILFFVLCVASCEYKRWVQKIERKKGNLIPLRRAAKRLVRKYQKFIRNLWK